MNGFPGGSDNKECACNAGDLNSILGSGRCPRGNGYPLQYSCLGNPMDMPWWATIQNMVLLGDFLTRKCKFKVKDKAAVCWSWEASCDQAYQQLLHLPKARTLTVAWCMYTNWKVWLFFKMNNCLWKMRKRELQ